MKASTLILVAAFAGVAYLFYKQQLLTTGKGLTSNTQGGNQSTLPKTEYQSTVDDISSMFSNATKLFGGGTAQTAPKST